MTTFSFDAYAAIPGIDDVRESVESEILWGAFEVNRTYIQPGLIDGAIRDAGHPSAAVNPGASTLIRPGFLLTANNTTKKWQAWAGVGTPVDGILLYVHQTQQNGADADAYWGFVLVGGQVKSKSLVIPGENDPGIDGVVGPPSEADVRTGLAPRFFADDAWFNS